MGRNDRLSPSCTEARERERKHAVDRVGWNELYQSFMVSHQWDRQGRHHLPALRRLGLVAVSVLGRNVVDARGIEVVGLCGGRDLFDV